MRVTYLLPCKCGATARVTSVQAGEKVKCPACGAETTAPGLRDLERLQAAEKPHRRRRRDRRWGTRKICILLGLYMAAGSLAALAIIWSRQPELPDTSTLTPLESWHAWMALRQGLNRQLSWGTYELIQLQKNLRLAAYFFVTTAVLGLGISLTAFLMRKRRTSVARPLQMAREPDE
jgi:hypothetical protein